jgi:hypothetical protein
MGYSGAILLGLKKDKCLHRIKTSDEEGEKTNAPRLVNFIKKAMFNSFVYFVHMG